MTDPLWCPECRDHRIEYPATLCPVCTDDWARSAPRRRTGSAGSAFIVSQSEANIEAHRVLSSYPVINRPESYVIVTGITGA